MVCVFDIQMVGQHIGQTTNFASAHRVGLTCQAEGAAALFADTTSGKVAVQDRVDLIAAANGLVHALGIQRHDLIGTGPEAIEGLKLGCGQAAVGGGAGLSLGHGGVKAVHMRGDIVGIDVTVRHEMRQKAVEQRGIAIGANAQVHVGNVAGRSDARIDVDYTKRRAFCLGRCDALEQDRVTPRGVRPHQNDQIGLFQIGIGVRHSIGAKGAFVASHGRGHAQTGIRIDIRRTDETLHQLVGDIVIFGQQLAGHIERDRIRPVFTYGFGKLRSHQIQRCVPVRLFTGDLRGQKAARQIDGFPKGRALGTQAAKVGGMVRIAFDRAIRPGQHATAHTTVGAGCPCQRHSAAT